MRFAAIFWQNPPMHRSVLGDYSLLQVIIVSPVQHAKTCSNLHQETLQFFSGGRRYLATQQEKASVKNALILACGGDLNIQIT
eukprot:1648828-Amphidinium_carterae.1